MANTKDVWWSTTMGGQRWGWLIPTEFVQQIESLTYEGVGEKAPLLRFSRWVGVGKSTVYRWADGTDPIPKWVAVLLKSALQWQAGNDAFPVEVTADWLPYSEGANGRKRPASTPPDGDSDVVAESTHAHAIVTSPTFNTRWPRGVTP